MQDEGVIRKSCLSSSRDVNGLMLCSNKKSSAYSLEGKCPAALVAILFLILRFNFVESKDFGSLAACVRGNSTVSANTVCRVCNSWGGFSALLLCQQIIWALSARTTGVNWPKRLSSIWMSFAFG